MNAKNSIALTGFMGVGKSSVARHLSAITGFKQVDLDRYIEKCSGRKIAEIFDHDGEAAYRDLETEHLTMLLSETDAAIVSLGGGTWTIERNRAIIRSHGLVSVWLESTFEHCWQNIRKSRKERPLARNKKAARELFDSRQSVYCLADWHFIVRPEFNSYEIAQQIAEQVLS